MTQNPEIIFFDYNSTSKPSESVLQKMCDVYQMPLNSSAIHQLGRKANFLVEEARNQLRSLLNGKNYEVIFTSGATESNNATFFGCEAQEILFCGIEHASVFNCRPPGKKITEIAAEKNGVISLSDLVQKIPSCGNFLVSLMHANNETGAVQPVEEVAKITHQNGGLFHCDIVQTIGKIDVDLESINADFVSVSAHKLQGPQGVGALLFRKGLDLNPLILGSKQEKGKRAGTQNVAGIAGFGEACKQAAKHSKDFKKTADLRDYLENSLKKIAGDSLKIFSEEIVRLPNTSFSAIRFSDAQTQIINFDLHGICVSAGAACSSGTLSESRILKSMNVAQEFLNGAIRVSLSPYSTIDEVNKFIAVWQEFFLRNLRAVS